MRILIYNDGKGKLMSFEATLEGSSYTGYGSSQEEAIQDLKRKINLAIAEFQAVDYNNTIAIDGMRRIKAEKVT